MMDSDEVNFKVDLQRARVYWSYYTTLFLMACLALIAGILAVSIIHTAGGISLLWTAALIVVFYIMLLVLFAGMTFIVWRHENRHLDELMDV